MLVPRRNMGVVGVRKRTLSQQVRVSLFSLMILMVVTICTLGLLFLQHFNNIATKGYEVRRLENERMSLIKANEINEMKVSEVKTLDSIIKSEVVARMVKIDPKKISYVRGETGVALK